MTDYEPENPHLATYDPRHAWLAGRRAREVRWDRAAIARDRAFQRNEDILEREAAEEKAQRWLGRPADPDAIWRRPFAEESA